MRKFAFAAFTVLAVALGSFATASAAPTLGDGSNNPVPQPSYSLAGG